MDLIHALPYDLARDCLIRIPYDQLPTVGSVCKSWKSEIELPEFGRIRKSTGHAQKIVVMAQARVHPDTKNCVLKKMVTPDYRLSIYNTGSGHWSDLTPVPGFSGGLPIFCKLVAVGSDLVVMGGWDPETCKVSNSVFIYNFVSATWKRGTDMPGGCRTFFGCASDSDRMVYVSGGHDDEKNALRSALAYDVSKDQWFVLPDMQRERDECKAVFQRGKLHVVGGYSTEMQGRFQKSSEVFDTGTWMWDRVEEDFLEAAICPRTCVGGDVAIYMCKGGDVVAYDRDVWQVVAKVPAEVGNTADVITWQRQLMVIGSVGFGVPHMAYTLDLKNMTWTRIEIPEIYSGHVQSGCYLEI